MAPMTATVEAPLADAPLLPRRWPLRLVALLLAAAGLLLAYEAYRVSFGTNIHTVIPERVYRCAQPSAETLEQLIAQYRIRTVINLRGSCDGMEWYADECRATHRHNVSQYDFNFSANRFPSVSEMRELVEVLDRAEYPILLHCRRGADRTGMVSTMVLLLQSDTSPADARRQLGLRYGHLAVGRGAALDQFVDFYEDWLRTTGKQHTPDNFRAWLLHHYIPGSCWSELSLAQPLPQDARCGKPIALHVRVRNTSLLPWRLSPLVTAGVHLGCHIFDERDRLIDMVKTGLRDCEVLPGQTVDFTLVLPPLLLPGRYRLQLDMVDEQQCWFYQVGSQPLEQELIVRE
jgi:protein tyrosine phosphatase (PTP) superfamily phosphohydrolase (DUF442 family)